MKKLLIIYIVLLIQFQNESKSQVELSPLNINFIGIEAKGDTVIAWGDHGSMLISYDNGNIWEQISVFESHQILKIFWNDEEVIALNSVGQFAKSIDKFFSWEIVGDIQTNILAVIQYPHGYFIRTPEKVMTIGNDIKIKNEFDILSPTLFSHFKFEYRKSLAYYNEQLIVAIDSSRFIRFDKDLQNQDIISFSELFGTNITSTYEVDIIDNKFYARIGNTGYTTSDFASIERVYSSKYYGYFKYLDSKWYNLVYSDNPTFGKYAGPFRLHKVINPDSLELITSVPLIRETIYSFKPNDFIIHKERLIAVGNNKLIISKEMNDTLCKFHSFFYASSLPERVNDSTYLYFIQLTNNSFYGHIYKTTDNGITFQPTYDFSRSGKYNRFVFKYYNPEEDLLYLFTRNNEDDGTQGLYISPDYGKSGIFVDSKEHPYLKYGTTQNFANLQIKDNYFISTAYSIWQNKAYIGLRVMDKNFNGYYTLFDSNYVINYVYYVDTTNYTFFCYNSLDNHYEIKQTLNSGKSFDAIKKYSVNNTFVQYKDLETQAGKLVCFVNYDKNDSIVTFDIFNTTNMSVETFYQYKVSPNYDENCNAIDFNDNVYYIAIEDTLFYTDDIFDRSKWNHYLLPKGGRILKKFQKFDSTFIAYYMDEKRTMGLYNLKLNSNPASVEDYQTEDMNYLYSYPAYPMPASHEVRTLVYWDMSFDVENYDIAVYDVLGNKVSDESSIRIEPHTSYSGNVIWNCSGVEPGIYLMRIKHGTEAKTIKVMVQR